MNDMFNEDMTLLQARTIYFRSMRSDMPKIEKDKVQEEYFHVRDIILEKTFKKAVDGWMC